MGGHNKQKTKITLNISLFVCSDLASSTLIPKFGSLCLWTYSQFPFNRTACLLFSFYFLLNIYYIQVLEKVLYIFGSFTLAVTLCGVVASVILYGGDTMKVCLAVSSPCSVIIEHSFICASPTKLNLIRYCIFRKYHSAK